MSHANLTPLVTKQQTGGCNSGAVAMPDGMDKRELATTTDSTW